MIVEIDLGGVRVVIPGVPVAQGRGRAVPTKRGIRVMDPERAKKWKRIASVHMRMAMGASNPMMGALAVTIDTVFPLPKQDHRKGKPPGRDWRTQKPDGDNLTKAVFDAGNGILWHDDAQVAWHLVRKIRGAQGEPPRVIVNVQPLIFPPENSAGPPV